MTGKGQWPGFDDRRAMDQTSPQPSSAVNGKSAFEGCPYQISVDAIAESASIAGNQEGDLEADVESYRIPANRALIGAHSNRPARCTLSAALTPGFPFAFKFNNLLLEKLFGT
jgi:hypothetical protein